MSTMLLVEAAPAINTPSRAIWLAIVVLAAALVSVVAALIAWQARPTIVNTVTAGAGAFVVTVTLCLAAIEFVTR